MCLGVPGQVTEIEKTPLGVIMGKVNFGGIIKEVCLSYVPEVKVGEYVIAHAGFAISQIDEQDALETLEMLQQIQDLSELDIPQP